MTQGGERAARPRQQGGLPTVLLSAIEHHRAGRLGEAEALYRKVLQGRPDDADALHFLGVVAVDRGQPERGIRLIERALQRTPYHADAHANLGNALRAVGRPADACASYRRAIALRPDFAAAHANLGLVLHERGDLVAALASCQRAVDLDPRQPDALTALGNVLRALGRFERAELALRQAARLRPDNGGLLANLGNLLIEMKRPEDAAACYRAAIAAEPRLARAHHGLGTSLSLTGDSAGALACHEKAVALDPRKAVFWNDLGRAQRALGRFEPAAKSFRRALDINSAFADAYRNLATCRRIAADTPDLIRIAALADNPDLPAEERAIAGFALGNALDAADRFDQAFIAYSRANAVYRATPEAMRAPFDAAALRRQVDATIATFDRAFFASVAGCGNPSETPVFIVGMPRSGTSLVEQIAASHSRVFGAGELRQIGEAAAHLGAVPAMWQPDTVRRLADAHLGQLRTRGGGADRVVDKLPDNVFMLGVIATLFPRARVIFCQRDARDIGLSCFFQKFSPGQLMFSYDLADCGTRCRETARLMEHWQRVSRSPCSMSDTRRWWPISKPKAEG